MVKSIKEAIYILLDTYSPTKHDNTAWSILKSFLMRKIFQQYEGYIGLITFNDNGKLNGNDLQESGEFTNINVRQKCGLLDWNLFEIMKSITPSSNQGVDIIDAIIVGAHHLRIETSKDIPERRILLISNVENKQTSYNSDERIQLITQAFCKEQFSLDIICPDLVESRLSDNDCSQLIGSELVLAKLINKLSGSCFSYSEAAEVINVFETRAVRSTAMKFTLDIGGLISIPTAMYIRVREKPLRQFKSRKIYTDNPNIPIETEKKFVLKEDFNVEVKSDDVLYGYRYGNTLVPISDQDKSLFPAFNYEKGLSVIAFVPSDQIKHYHCMGSGLLQVLCDPKAEEADKTAFISFVASLYETESAAIVRKVYRKGTSAEIGFLKPFIDDNDKCLYYCRLPFKDDLRCSTLQNLVKSVHVNENALDAADRLINHLLLINSTDEGDIDEELKPENTFNPSLQNYFKIISEKILNPCQTQQTEQHYDPINELIEVKMRNNDVKECVDNFVQAFSLCKHKQETQDFKITKSDNNFDDSQATEHDSAFSEEDSEFLNDINETSGQIVSELFKLNNEDAIIKLNNLRSSCIASQIPDSFNDVMKKIKNEQFGTDLWLAIVKNKLKPISVNECKKSYIFEDESNEFLNQPLCIATKIF
ncbi:hypothetical protein GJ496_009986 [Pomphorhynchus laevis]|nr:hypothetical protein GJ496_009986 [Pomphorhynchus laevis]